MSPQIIALALGGVALAVLFFGVISSLRPRREIEQRLERFATVETGARQPAQEARPRMSLVGDSINKALAGRSFADDIATQLARADLKLTVFEYLIFLVASVVVGGALGFLLSSGSIVFALLIAVVGFFVPRTLVGMAQSRRLRAFNNQLGDFLNMMVNGLRAGYSATQAMEAVASELSPPLATEVGRVVQEMQLGLTQEQALANMLRRVKSDDLDLIVTAMNVQREVGGNLAEILDKLSEVIRERFRLLSYARVLSAQHRASAYCVAASPFAMAIIFATLNPGYFDALLRWPNAKLLIAAALVMQVIGFFMLKRIATITV